MKKAADSKKTTLTRTDTRPVLEQTKASSGDARVWVQKNADNTERLCILNPVAGFWASNVILGTPLSTIASLVGAVATSIKNGVTIAGVKGTYASDGNITAGDVLSGKIGYNSSGKVTGNITSKAATTYNTSTSDRTIAAKTYLSGDQVIKGVTTENILAANVKKGVVVKVGDANNAGRIKNVTGTWYGNKKCISAMAICGFRTTEGQPSDETSFTMPENGTVYYGGMSAFYNGVGDGTLEIYQNGTRKDHRNSGEGFIYRGTMWDKSFAANKGDVIKVKATATSGTATVCSIQAVIVY